MKILAKLRQFEVGKNVQDRLCPHTRLKYIRILVLKFAMPAFRKHHHRLNLFQLIDPGIKLFPKAPSLLYWILLRGHLNGSKVGNLLPRSLHRLLSRPLIHTGNHILGKVEHSLQVPRRNVQQESYTARCPLHKPDVAYRSSQINVPHPLPAYLCSGHLYATFITNNAPIAYLLILATVAFKILCRPEDSLTEKPIPLWL